MAANPNMAKSGLLNCVISPEAGKWSYIACFLCISGRYSVYVACEIYYEFRTQYAQSIKVDISGPKGGRPPSKLTIGNAMQKGNSSTQERGFKCKGSIAPACPGGISQGADE